MRVFFVQQTSETTENRDSNLMKSESFHGGASAFSTFRERLSAAQREPPDGIKKLQGWISHKRNHSYFHGELAMC